MTYETHLGTRSVLYRLLRERYTPTPMPRWAGPVWSLLLAVGGLVIGGDLIRIAVGSPAAPEQLAYLDYIGLAEWGAMMVGSSLLVVAAFLSRSLALVILTHMLALGLWFALALAYFQGQVAADSWTGVRMLVLVLGGAAMWGVRTVILARDFYRPTANSRG